MATKAKSDKSVEEPDPVVDPPEVTPTDTVDEERGGGQQWVQISQSVMLTLPSGASYNFSAGNVLQMSDQDAAYVVDQGYGSKIDDPTGE